MIVINEPPEATEKFKYLGKIKSKLTQKNTIKETKGIDQIEIESWANYILTSNNPNPIQEEKGDRRLIYFEVNNSKCGDEEYFNKLCKDFQPIKQGDYTPEYMELLLHYMRSQIDVSEFNPEALIRKINSKSKVLFNEQLERQYLDLNAVDRFIVDNHKCFIHGLAIDNIKIEGYKQTGLARKLLSVCEMQRIRRKQYEALIESHPDCYNNIYVDDSKNQYRIYKLKQREQIPDLYAIIEYKAYEESFNEEEESEEEEKPVNLKVVDV